MRRLILSILAGFIVTAVLSIAVDHVFHVTNVYPPYGEAMFNTSLLALAFAYRAVFNVFGAFVTASIAKDKAMKAVWIMGIVGSLLWLAGALANWELAAPWYNILGVVTGIPFSLAGGKLYQRSQLKKVYSR
jgi:hypothetical protein